MFTLTSTFPHDPGDLGNAVGWEEVLRYKHIEQELYYTANEMATELESQIEPSDQLWKEDISKEKLLAFLYVGDSNLANVMEKKEYVQNSNSKCKESTVIRNQNNHSLFCRKL